MLPWPMQAAAPGKPLTLLSTFKASAAVTAPLQSTSPGTGTMKPEQPPTSGGYGAPLTPMFSGRSIQAGTPLPLGGDGAGTQGSPISAPAGSDAIGRPPDRLVTRGQ